MATLEPFTTQQGISVSICLPLASVLFQMYKKTDLCDQQYFRNISARESKQDFDVSLVQLNNKEIEDRLSPSTISFHEVCQASFPGLRRGRRKPYSEALQSIHRMKTTYCKRSQLTTDFLS